ncbi:MAG TPA: GNAT family N-acetyltransferase [Candidatus Limnocylindrales bacterium]|nr:GNAT family N-acetyltransferase [Candidatus Limnocylindrales bacterium]
MRIRPGRVDDVPELVQLWRHEVEHGRQDIAPGEQRLRAMLAHFDWGSKSRVIDDHGKLAGAVLVIARPSPDGVLANLYAGGLGSAYVEMVRWGVEFSRAAGASIAQIYVAKGLGDGLEHIGLRAARPWWRMDRGLGDGLPSAPAVAGYEVVDATAVPAGTWSDMFNRTFADHWRFVPRGEAEIVAGRTPELCLMAVTAGRRAPAAITLGEVEKYAGDPRPQPVGLISSVGTLPEHRRRGLAGWLVAESLCRLQAAGASTASLYVDGMNPQRADAVYRKLGFEVAFEAEVWEATFP